MLEKKTVVHTIVGLVIFLSIVACFSIVILLESKSIIFSMAARSEEKIDTIPFPVSVDPLTETITENSAVDSFFIDSLADAPNSKDNWWNKLAALFVDETWYQNLASPVGRIIVVWPGERKEELTKKIGDILHWSKQDRIKFQSLIDTSEPALSEGKYYPGQYVAHHGATPEEVYPLLFESFRKEILKRYTKEVSDKVPLEDALIIASLLEREASDFNNMREVSGVIWNRLFIDMPLQLDATLQYVKGSNPSQPKWWPVVKPADKYLKSPFNTYTHPGLPPAPIANPSAEAILAALNPVVTDCLFYFHSSKSSYHCSATYEEHVRKLRSIYGRGS